jgi:hypothetical protein
MYIANRWNERYKALSGYPSPRQPVLPLVVQPPQGLELVISLGQIVRRRGFVFLFLRRVRFTLSLLPSLSPARP